MYVGNATLAPFHITPGKNIIPSSAKVHISNETRPYITKLMAKYINGEDQIVNVTGRASGSDVPYFRLALETLESYCVLPGNTDPLITYAYIKTDILDFLEHRQAPVQLSVVNRYDVDLTLMYVKFDVYDSSMFSKYN